MKHRGAIQRRIRVGNVMPRAQLFEYFREWTHRLAGAALAMLLALFAAPVAAQTTTVTITAADRPSFSREGQPLTFHVRLDTGNTEVETLAFTSGSPTGASALSCPGLPADLMTTTYCTFTYTTTAMDVAMGKVTALGRWRITRPTGAARNGSTNNLSLPYTPPRAPDAPDDITATAADGEATVAFDAPFDGGYPISGYTVTSSPGAVTTSGTGSPLVVTGLTNGVAYRFTVRATSSMGPSPASAASAEVTPKAEQTIAFANPGLQFFGTTPTLTATASSTLPVTFTSATEGICTLTGAQLAFVAAGTCTIHVDQEGDGTYAAAPRASQSFTVAPVLPGAPTIGAVTVGDGQATVNFTAPAFTGGSSIIEYTVTSSPGGLTVSRAAAPITITGLTNGTAYTFTVTATNIAGTGASSATSASVTPQAAPGVTSVGVPASGNYGAGQNLDFTVNWDQPVTITGAPGVGLVIGSTSVQAQYLSGSGSTATTFRYIVQAGQVDTDGIAVVALSLNGGSIRNGAGQDAVPTLNSVGITTGVLVTAIADTTRPSVTAMDRLDASPTAAGSVRYRLRFSEPVTGVDVNDFVLVQTGTATGAVALLMTSDNIEYTVTVDSVTGNGTLRLDLLSTGTAIADAAGNSATGHTGGPAYTIDRTSPTVTGVAVPAAGQYIAGQNLVFTLSFSEAVNVTGTPGLPITFNVGGTREAAYVSGSGTDALVFSYTVVAADHDSDGATLAGAFVLNGGTIADGAGAAADPALHGVGSMTGVVIGLLPQAITGFAAHPVAPVYVPDGTFTVSATGGASGLPVTYASATPAVCSVSGGTVTMIAAGVCSLTADQAGDSRHAAAPQATLDVPVGMAAQGITGFGANPAEPVYSRGGSFALSAIGGASGLPVVFASSTTSVCTVSGSTVTMLSAGTCALTADQAGNVSFAAAPQVVLQVVIGRAMPTLAWVADMNRTLGEAAFDLPDPGSDSSGAFTFTSSDPAVATVSGRTVTLVGAGVTTLVATQAAAGNYAQASVGIVLAVVDRPDPTRDASVVGGLQAQVDASVRFAAAQQSNIQDRMRQLRSTRTSTSSNALTLSVASLSGTGLSISADELASFQDTRLPQGMAVWTAGTITSGGRDADGQATGFDFRSDGVTLGADWRLSERFLFGVAGGWGWNDTDLDEARSNLDARQRALSLYGLWRPGQRWFVDGIVGWGELDFDIRRYSTVAGTAAIAQRSGDQSFGALTGGYERAGGDGMTLTGYGRLDASRTRLDAYREHGLGLYDLAYGAQTVESSGASLGVEGSFPILAASGDVFRPYWMLEYRESLDDSSEVDLNYVVLPVDNGYALGMRSFGDNALTYGGGIDLDIAAGWKLSVLARRQHGDGQRPSSSFGLTLTFAPQARDAAAMATPEVEAFADVAAPSPPPEAGR